MTAIRKKHYRSLFEYQDRIEEITKKPAHIAQLNEIIPWETFREKLDKVFHKDAKGPGGAPHFDYVMMFKILILQRLVFRLQKSHKD